MRTHNSLITAIVFVSMCFVSCSTAIAGSNNGNKQLPQIASVNPSVTYAGSRQVSLAVYGSNFNGKSVLLWNGNSRPTTYSGSGTLVVTLSDNDVAAPTTAQVQVLNNNSGSKSNSVPVTVAPPAPLAIATTSLPAATQNVSYSTALSATGGTTPYTWTLSGGTLPSGLTLASNGTISGTPSTTGQFNISVRLTDSSSNSASSTYTLNVSASANTIAPLAIVSQSLPYGMVGSPYFGAAEGSGGVAPYTWSVASGTLPASISLAATTGALSGTPSAQGTYSFTLKVTDASAATATQSFAVTIGPPSATDQFGGYTSMPSPNPATGWFRTEKFGSRWMFVDPANNAFFSLGIYSINPDQDVMNGTSLYQVAAKKYGNADISWAEASMERLKGWGFNTGVLSSIYTQPIVKGGWAGDGYIPTKAPFFINLQSSAKAMINESGYLPEGVKNFQYGLNLTYDPYWKAGLGEADYFDPKLYQEMTAQLQHGQSMYYLNQAPMANKQYLIGIAMDESDQTYSLSGPGNEWPTYPETGYNHAHGGFRVAICSPFQTANADKNAVYSDTKVYLKSAWRDYLVNTYGTISALNAAWGSNYTTFDSSGTTVKGEAIGSGSGSTTSFSKTLAQRTISKFTLQILVNGIAVAGDIGNGTIFGRNVSGKIDYSLGTLSLTFTVAPTGPITANYIANGWGYGTGVLDEDGRHTSWMGTDAVLLTAMNANTRTDVGNFLYQIAKYYLTNGRTVVNTYFEGLVPGWHPLFTGSDMYGGYVVPAPHEVLKALGESADFIILNGTPAFSQAQWDYMYQYYGDRPLVVTNFTVANPDSIFNATPAPPGNVQFSSQAARGQAYYDGLVSNFNSTTNGTHMVIGQWLWKWADQVPSKENFGLVTVLDNAYDGHEAVISTGSCSGVLQQYACGGELKNYGDVISGVKAGNSYVDSALSSGTAK